jgi:predicted nucleotidyltransferase
MHDVSEIGELSVDTETIESVLVDTPVSVAVLYGSHARGEATEHSDIDLAVVFDETLSSVEKTRARLALIERLSVSLGTNAVDVTPLIRAPQSLQREIYRDVILLYGSEKSLPAIGEDVHNRRTHTDRMAEFDDVLTDIERIV